MTIKEEREVMLEQINELTYKLLVTFSPGDYPQMQLLDISATVKQIKEGLAK